MQIDPKTALIVKIVLGALALVLAGPAAAQNAPTIKLCTPSVSSSSGVVIQSCQDVGTGNPFPMLGAVYSYTNITGDVTTTIKSGAGFLHAICVNTPAATETITVYDNTAASGTKIATLTSYASNPGCEVLDVQFSVGLTVVTGVAAGDITVSWK